MPIRKLSLLVILLAGLSAFSSSVLTAGKPESTAARLVRADHIADSLLAVMTLEEKVGQLQQFAGEWNDSLENASVRPALREMIRKGTVGSVLNVFGADIVRDLQTIAVKETRLGIPLLLGFDVIHGFKTTFPIPLAEASSWDVDAVKGTARIAAQEASSAGIHWTFAPMVDIARDPRWGRIAEGSGEDTYLGALMAEARVKGFQGDDLSDPTSILACMKHFAAYGAGEGGRDYNSVDISERTLREVYLPPFEAGIRAGAATVMSSFNEIAGVPSTGNANLLNGILRNEWGFDGLVVSDWNSVGELQIHGITPTLKDAAALAITSGTDMDMETGAYQNHLVELVREGKVSEKVVATAARRILRAKVLLGLFDDPYRSCTLERQRGVLLQPSNIDAARDMAKKSIVLLKNERSLLPLAKTIRSLAVIGPLADDRSAPLGPWAGPGRIKNVVTVLQGIKNAVGNSVNVSYHVGCPVENDSTAGIAAAVAAARKADVVLLVLGESADMSGEAASRATLGLPGCQEELARAVVATGKPVVAILMNGRPLAIPWIASHVPAILETWFLGLQSGNAIADVVFGDYAPSARLPVSFPRVEGQIPVYYNHKGTGRPGVDGVKYSSRYRDVPVSPLYPFGFGLTYTSFAYNDLQLDTPELHDGGAITISVRVRNTGTRPGDEVVQLYVRDDFGSVTRPVKELKAFKKVRVAPGTEERVSFTLTPEQLAFYNREMKKVVEPGKFTVYVGPNSAEGLTGSFEYRQMKEAK